MYLPSDHPLWDDHGGGTGHDMPAWKDGDEEKALVYWNALDDRSRAVLRYLFGRSGWQIHNGELVKQLGLDPEGRKNAPNVLAGVLNRVNEAGAMTGRRPPFRWWAGEDGARYAVPVETAAVFERAVLADRVQQKRGTMLALALDPPEVRKFIEHLDWTFDGPDVRMVLGSACTTVARAIPQFVAALQLPYDAAFSTDDFFDHLDDVSRRRCIVVTDACSLLKYEDVDVWADFVLSLYGGPYCMGGGWSTLVLVDQPHAWEDWAFRSTPHAIDVQRI